MLAILLLAPSTRRFSLWIPFKPVDRVDLGLHVGGGALHLNRDRMHQRFERSRIVCEPGDELARLRRSWNHNFPREPLDRQIGGIEDVAMRVDMRSIRGAMGCAQVDTGNAALPAANVMPPATNSRRRMVCLVRMLPKAIWHCPIVPIYCGCEWARHKGRVRRPVLVTLYAYSLHTRSTLRSLAP